MSTTPKPWHQQDTDSSKKSFAERARPEQAVEQDNTPDHASKAGITSYDVQHDFGWNCIEEWQITGLFCSLDEKQLIIMLGHYHILIVGEGLRHLQLQMRAGQVRELVPGKHGITHISLKMQKWGEQSQ